MKKTVITLIAFVAGFCGCFAQEPTVMARFVPERADDFIFENDLIAGRFYGKGLEHCGPGEVISPGVDVWVKTPGGLVANKRYEDELKNGKSYHKDWGNGKDCYKVSRSLGAGASSPIVDGKICMPTTNFRKWKVIKSENDRISFALTYPEWEIEGGIKVSLKKKLTVKKGSYFVRCVDIYTFKGAETLTIAAGVNRHANQKGCMIAEEVLPESYTLWEHASDQSVESEDGLLGIAVVMPGSDKSCITDDGSHGVCCKTIKSGEKLTYYFGSCWTEGDVKDFDSWKKIAKKVIEKAKKAEKEQKEEKKQKADKK